jgi:anti-sigma regulatory factor (Ser/Thr protein kinase)
VDRPTIGKIWLMTEQRGEPRPEAASQLDLRVRARTENVLAVRRAFDALDMPAALLEDAKLLASELMTNSIRHSGLKPDELVHVTANWTGKVLRVSVRDRTDDAAPSPVAGSIRPLPGAESGWGLYLVDRIASRWGTSVDGGAGYWFELEPTP